MVDQNFSKPRRKNAVCFQSPFEYDSSSLDQDGLSSLTSDKPTFSRTSSNMELSTFDGFSVARSVLDADWLKEISFALEEMTLDSDLEMPETGAVCKDEKDVEYGSVKLTEGEEREIERKVRIQLAHEFKKIYFEAHDKNKQIKKIFRSYLEEARSSILNVRVEVDETTTETLERVAEEEQAKMLKRRVKRKETADKSKGLPDLNNHKEKAMEFAHVRKIHADLDRARTRRERISKTTEKKESFKKKDVLLGLEIKKLERDDEVHSLILRLYESGLHENARILTNALAAKEASEKSIREEMKKRKVAAKTRAMARLRSERMEEKARKERERLERERVRKKEEEEESMRRILAALKRKARNQERQWWATMSFLHTRTSRPHSFSYF